MCEILYFPSRSFVSPTDVIMRIVKKFFPFQPLTYAPSTVLIWQSNVSFVFILHSVNNILYILSVIELRHRSVGHIFKISHGFNYPERGHVRCRKSCQWNASPVTRHYFLTNVIMRLIVKRRLFLPPSLRRTAIKPKSDFNTVVLRVV